MFEFVETVRVHAPPADVWKVLVDVRRWWLASNPDHSSLEIRSTGEPIGVGTQILFVERVAGIPGRAEGAITQWVEGRAVTWQGVAVYRHRGITITIEEGVTWTLSSSNGYAELSARVWALFPRNLIGRLGEWYFKHVLNGVERDREHARRELEYVKATIERRAV